MDRSVFLKSILTVGVATAARAETVFASSDPAQRKVSGNVPPYIKPGDLVAVASPASPVELKETLAFQAQLKNWGYNCCIGNSIGQKWQRFGGTDEERAADLQSLLDDPQVKAIIFGRGGYGALRILDRLNWEKFEKQPKWLVGFSDITAIHCEVHSRLNIATIHGSMVINFKGEDTVPLCNLEDALRGERMQYRAPFHPLNRPGLATGQLVGGNLSLICATMGSLSELDTKGKILFLEDVSEYKYTIDRMMLTLKRSGKLELLAGLILGGFTATKEDKEAPFQMSIEEIILEKVADKKFPVCFHFPAGHIKENLALKLGIHYNLYVSEISSMLGEVQDPHPPLPAPLIRG